MNSIVSQPGERNWSKVWWYSSCYVCITFQMVAGLTSCGWVYSMNGRGQSGQPWGAPVLSTIAEELNCLGSVCEEIQYLIAECGAQAQTAEFARKLY